MDSLKWTLSDIALIDDDVEIAGFISDDTEKTTFVFDKEEIASGLVPFITIDDSCAERTRLSNEIAETDLGLDSIMADYKDFINHKKVIKSSGNVGEDAFSFFRYVLRDEKWSQALKKVVLDEAKRELLKFNYSSTERQMFMF